MSEKKIRKCDVCGATSETKEIRWIGKANLFLCAKHRSQIERTGKITNTTSRTIRDRNDIIEHEDYAEIIIRNNKQEVVAKTIIDKDDVERCRKIKWHINSDGYVHGGNNIKLHRFILGYFGKECIDHINRNIKDNRKANLRVVSFAENAQNNGSKGIYKASKTGKWYAVVRRYGLRYHVGTFSTKQEAVAARENFIIELEKQKKNMAEEYSLRNGVPATGIMPYSNNKWTAEFCADGKKYYVGIFDSKEEAIEARAKAKQEYLKQSSVA